jgi:hypothetical protein
MLEKILNNRCQNTCVQNIKIKTISNGYGHKLIVKGIFDNDFGLKIIVK